MCDPLPGFKSAKLGHVQLSTDRAAAHGLIHHLGRARVGERRGDLLFIRRANRGEKNDGVWATSPSRPARPPHPGDPAAPPLPAIGGALKAGGGASSAWCTSGCSNGVCELYPTPALGDVPVHAGEFSISSHGQRNGGCANALRRGPITLAELSFYMRTRVSSATTQPQKDSEVQETSRRNVSPSPSLTRSP